MTLRARQLLPALLVGTVLAAAGCGSSSEEEPEPGRGLPQSFVDQLEPRLEEVQRRYDDGVENGNVGSCEDIAGDSFAGPAGIDEILTTLPQDVDPQLRRAVERSVENLRTLTEDCVEQAEEAAPEPAPAPEPVPVEPIPEEEVPEEEPEEKDKDKDKDKNGGGGNGNGGDEAPAPAPEPAPQPEDAPVVPPGQGGGVPAPPPRGQQGSKKGKPPKDER